MLEFLEVEVTSHVTDNKLRSYERLWWYFDDFGLIAFQVWRQDRYGIVSPLLTGETAVYVMDYFLQSHPHDTQTTQADTPT